MAEKVRWPKAHKASGNPGVVDVAAQMAFETVQEIDMTAPDVTALTLVHLLAVELAEAMRRISELERESEHA